MKRLQGIPSIKIILIALVGLSILFWGTTPIAAQIHPGMGRVISDERDFLIHMIPHHEEAISAAAVLAENTERAPLRDFAHLIIETQSAEIELMESYLDTWYPDADRDVSYTPMMRELEGLAGEDLERAFLEDMIVHHMEAVMMSQRLLGRRLAQNEEVAALAVRIRDNQRTEISTMRDWLFRWYSSAPMMGRRDGSMMMWNGWSGWFMPLMVVGLIAVLALIVLAVWLLVKALSSSPGSGSPAPGSVTPRERLDMRYARGDISREEYLAAKEDLKS